MQMKYAQPTFSVPGSTCHR